MGRHTKEINTNEVDEIIDLAIKDLGGDKSKITYNNVWNFNKKLVKNKVKRKDGEKFNLYGYSFWASDYKGDYYYGRLKIDEKKSSNEVILAGESFDVDIQDLLLLVEKHKQSPEELSKRIVKIFRRDKKRLKLLEEQNRKLNNEIKKLREIQGKFELGFTTLFYNSIFTDNSLNDVMSLKLSGDEYVRDELKKMFNNDDDKLNNILNSQSQVNLKKSFFESHDKATAKERLNKLFKRE